MSDPSPDLRSRLVDAAEEEVTAVGIGAVSLRAIARRAGVSHQAPGHVFRDRAGLFTAVATRGYDALADAVEGARAGAADAGEPSTACLSAVGMAYVAFAIERGPVFSVLARPELWDAGDADLARARRRAWGVLERSVDDAQAAGWARGRERRTIVLLCFSTVHGLATLARDGLLSLEAPEMTVEDITRRSVTTLTAGLAGAPPTD